MDLNNNFPRLQRLEFPSPPKDDREDIHGKGPTPIDDLFDRVAGLLRLQGMRLYIEDNQAVLEYTWNNNKFYAPDKESAIIMLCLSGAWSNAREK
jgi:hypothetical protein